MYRHHVEPRVKLYSPREEPFPIPLKYIDISRTTHTNLDVKQEKCIDHYWNIDGSRDLSDPRIGFTQFTLMEEKPPNGYMWSGERLTRKKLTSMPDHLWPELWVKQTSVSHSSTESEIISLDAALRLDGIPALNLWDLIVSVFGNTTQNHDRTAQPVVCRDASHAQGQQSRGMSNVLNNVDRV